MKIDLTGKTAVVTGGYGAIGSAMCEYYVKAGASVAVVDLNRERGAKFEEHLKKMGGNVKYYYGDVSDREGMERLCA